ncbi:MAG: TonB-dependent receptor [Proteobacteria bacterium]|nr:TonB-dependent receptor [Pseudomonadota bacterium]MCP4918359.1 TonB-dependent receptor [Pseudomonadota bacterium]
MILLVGLASAAEVTGTVRERGTGDPLVATVTAGDVAVQSAADGSFRLDLAEGAWTLEAFGPQYAPQAVEVTAPGTAEFFLVPSVAEATIVVEARREPPHVSAQVLDRERVEKAPGNFDDPVRLVQSLPGVAATPEYSPTAGAVAIRGAAPQESRFYLDGVEIPYLYHFHEYSSVFHTRLLDELALYPSTFGPSYGNAIGGAVEASSRQPEPTRLHGGVALNFVMGSAYVTIPVGERGALSASARRSYHDLKGGNDQYTVWPRFFDYLTRYDQDWGEGSHHLAVTAFGAGDAYTRFVGDTATFDPLEAENADEFSFDRSFHAISIRETDEVGDAQLRTSVAVVQDRWLGEVTDGGQDRLQRYIWLRHDARIDLTDAVTLAVGGTLKPEQVTQTNTLERAVDEIGDEAPLMATGVLLGERLGRVAGGAYAEGRFERGRWLVRPGVRLDADSAVGALVVDPRLSARVALSDDVRLRGAVGQYSQAPELWELASAAGNRDLPYGRSDQGAIGVDWAVLGRLELGAELWGKSMRDVVVREPGQTPEAVDGTAWGVELTTRYRLRDLFFAWGSVTVGRAMRDGAPFDFDQPLSVNLVASWDFRPGWNAGVRYRYASGLPYTPVDDSIYLGDTDTYEAVAGEPNSARLPAYQKVDVHLERTFLLRKWTVSGYAEGWYVPAANNAMYVVYSYDYSQSALVSGPSFLPLLGIRVDL